MTNDVRLHRVQQTLRRFEQDIPLLNLRVKDLSAERQESARQFAAALIAQTKAELAKLLEERLEERPQSGHAICEPAD
jgi:Spy/CpxP family protein refolding chaperone